MPELPDLEYVVPRLGDAVTGKRIASVRVKEPIVLRLAVEGDLASLVVGRTVGKIERRGNFVTFGLGDDLELVVNPMLAGRFRLTSPEEKTEAAMCFAFTLEDGGSTGSPRAAGGSPRTSELRYVDDRKMGKAYVLRRGDEKIVPGLTTLGVDVLSKGFTREHFRALAKKRRDQVRVFLMDKSAISAIGNAYADEILFEAGLHPKTMVRQLSAEDVDRLYDAVKSVMSWAIDEVEKAKPELHEKVREFVRVRRKKGEPCPKCGTTIRESQTHGAESYFCPTCQPLQRKALVDWRKLPK